MEGPVSTSNPDSSAGGSTATSRVCQAGQIKRVGNRGTEVPRRNGRTTLLLFLNNLLPKQRKI
jgi:hypothetical protein